MGSWVLVVQYLDENGDEHITYSFQEDDPLVTLVGILEWAKTDLLSDHVG